MREVQEILRLWARTEASGEGAILATVVKTQGSSYRLPGARLLFTRTGERVGSVSGGCLEGDLLKKSWWLTEAGPALRRYDTNPDGEIESGYGLGCNGIIHVLIERMRPHSAPVIETLARVRAERRPASVCRILSAGPLLGKRLTIDTDGVVTHDFEDFDLAHTIEARARLAFVDRATTVVHEAGYEVFVETLLPPTRLLVFGAGDDVIPLTDMAGLLGWPTHVYDGRTNIARPERFPAAERVLLRPASAPLDASDSFVPVDEWTVAVLMTHSYSQDLDVLTHLAQHPPPYVGLLGPRKRSLRLLTDAGLNEAQFGGRLFGPMGFDIGADGPEQVALSVVSEIQAVMNGRTGGQLRARQGSIHAREDSSVVSSTEDFSLGSIACA